MKPEIVRKSVLRASIRQGSGVATEGLQGLQTTTVHETIDLGTKVHDAIDLGTKQLGVVDLGTKHLGVVDLGTKHLGVVDTGVTMGQGASTTTVNKTIDLGTTNLGVVDTGVHLAEGQMTTSVKPTLDLGTKILPPVAGSTVNLGTIGTTKVTTTTTTTGVDKCCWIWNFFIKCWSSWSCFYHTSIRS